MGTGSRMLWMQVCAGTRCRVPVPVFGPNWQKSSQDVYSGDPDAFGNTQFG
jgi:hypothetical protein